MERFSEWATLRLARLRRSGQGLAAPWSGHRQI